jgi:hypothetical protein
MNKRQVIILWIIAIVLAAAVAVVKVASREDAQSATARAAGQTLFENFPATDVASVAISGAEGRVTLERKDGKWTVAERDAYPANPTSVNELLRTLAELKVTRGMEAGPSFAPRFGMDENASKPEDRGLTAVFKDAAGKDVATISLGKNIESGAEAGPFGGAATVGRYIRNHADESGFYAISEMFPSVSAEASRWLEDDFFSLEKIKSITLHQKGSEAVAWKLVRESEDAEFKLEGASGEEVLDNTAATPLKSLFSFARFNDVIPAAEVESRSDAANRRTAVIETFEGFSYQLSIAPAKPKEAAKEGDTPAAEEMVLTVSVSAELPKERKKEEGEKEEDAKTKDEAFASRLKTLTEKLEKEKALAGRSFLISKSTVDALLKERDQLITKAQPPAEGQGNQGSVQQLPGGIVATPPSGTTATTQPIEAVTPPIAVPQEGEQQPAAESQPAE